MKKLFLLIGLCLAGTAWLSAQNIVSGTVTDKKGNPIPGVKVEILGGTESTITELDGTFRLETGSPARKVKVYYAGMQPKAQKVKPDMLIKMSETSWWNEKPDKYRWFLGAQIVIPNFDEVRPSYGFMLGRVKNIGWYVKGVYNKPQSTVGAYSENNMKEYYWTTGESKQSFWSATGGVVARLWSPIHLYAGLGYGQRKIAWQLHNGSYYEYCPDTHNELLVVDGGIMLKMKRFFINGGISFLHGYNGWCDANYVAANAGIGVYF